MYREKIFRRRNVKKRRNSMNTSPISPEELNKALNEQPDCILIDVRTPAEFYSQHIPEAKNYPLHSKELSTFIETQKESNKIIFVTCQSGGRAKTACEELSKHNIQYKNLEGGMSAWTKKHLPVIEGKKTISIERQVRIAAGTLVVLGVILSFSGYPNATLLSGFVGAGLVFAGITDTCGMARVLSYMPWNK
jgi:rhodanese-related sulfurtransferase